MSPWHHLEVSPEPARTLLTCLLSVLQCSSECGAGVRTRSVVCMTNHISSLPLEGCGNNRPAEATPCDNGPCTGKVEWFAGSWSQVRSQSWVHLSVPGRGNIAEGLEHSFESVLLATCHDLEKLLMFSVCHSANGCILPSCVPT